MRRTHLTSRIRPLICISTCALAALAFPLAPATRGIAPSSASAATPTGNDHPGATTGAAASVTASTATINATIDDGDQPAIYTVQYGPTPAYTSQSAAIQLSPAPARQSVAVRLTGLEPGTTFHYRALASTDGGTWTGDDATFTTLGAASPPPNATIQVRTGPPLTATPHAVTVAADLYAPSAPVTYYVQFGPSVIYSGQSDPQTLPPQAQPQTSRVRISGLRSNATYHYRVVADGPAGPIYGADQVFDTTPTHRDTPAGLGLTVTATTPNPRSVKLRISGALQLPRGASPAACAGAVGIQVKLRSSTIATRQASLTAPCTYHTTLTVPARAMRRTRAIRIWARFEGNALLTPVTAPRAATPIPR